MLPCGWASCLRPVQKVVLGMLYLHPSAPMVQGPLPSREVSQRKSSGQDVGVPLPSAPFRVCVCVWWGGRPRKMSGCKGPHRQSPLSAHAWLSRFTGWNDFPTYSVMRPWKLLEQVWTVVAPFGPGMCKADSWLLYPSLLVLGLTLPRSLPAHPIPVGGLEKVFSCPSFAPESEGSWLGVRGPASSLQRKSPPGSGAGTPRHGCSAFLVRPVFLPELCDQ